jgi:hypothetical protein
MAYQLVQEDFYTQTINLPLGITQKISYGLRYDPVTGNYQLRQKDAITGSYDIGIGIATLYENGSWYSDAAPDSLLFESGNLSKPTDLANELAQTMKQETHEAFVAIGGNAGGNKAHESVDPSKWEEPSGANNFFPGTDAGIAKAVPIIGEVLSDPDLGTKIIESVESVVGTLTGDTNISDTGNLPGITQVSAPFTTSSVNENALFGETYLKSGSNKTLNRLYVYPYDILETAQDTLRVSMYNFQNPTGKELFDGTKNIATKGLQRVSSARKLVGTVILPIPNNVADNNSTSWGADQMNNLTAAIAADILSNPVQNAAGAAMGGLAKQLVGVNPTQQIQLIKQFFTNKNNLTDPNVEKMLRSVVASLSLKGSGFDVPPEQILARGLGAIPNNNLELLFNNVTIREFTFAYRFSPRSKTESKSVRRIIRFFKQGMAARKLNAQAGAGSGSLLIGAPNVFKLQYKTYDSQPIRGLNRFKMCALTNCSVNYAPEGQWSAFAEGQPVSMTMGLSFSEIEPIYENDYQEDNVLNDKDPDFDKITQDDIGY